MMIPKIHIIRTSDGVDFPLPTYASKHHVGLVLRAAIPSVLKLDAHERALVPIGFGIGIPDGLCGQIVSLPDVAKESGLIVLDGPQIVNPADRDALFVLLQNSSRRQLILRRGDPIAQLLVLPVYQICWDEMLGKTLRAPKTDLKYMLYDDKDHESAEAEQNTAPKEAGKRVVKSVRERTKAADNV